MDRSNVGTEKTMHAPPTPAAFWDRRADSYAKKPVPDEAAYAATLERVRAHLGPRDSVLELGCGTGTTALALAGNAGEILATDYSERMIAIATAKAGAAGAPNVRFRVTTLDDATLVPPSFDVVMAMNLLHLVGQLPAFLRHVHARVRPGGLFVSKTPCVGEQGRSLRIVIPVLRALGVAPSVSFVTERSLTADIARAGFDMVETGMYPVRSRSFFVVARRAATGGGRPSGSRHDFAE
jgi:2-polyprenyl-3-methyl-5-hydroxy-6-metoxy-1,4-benzoquinol methylase